MAQTTSRTGRSPAGHGDHLERVFTGAQVYETTLNGESPNFRSVFAVTPSNLTTGSPSPRLASSPDQPVTEHHKVYRQWVSLGILPLSQLF